MEPCKHQTRAYRLVEKPPFDEVPDYGVYQACWRNELAALLKRHLGDNPPLDKELMAQVAKNVDEWLATGTIEKWTPEQVLKHKRAPGQRKRYERAFNELAQRGLRESDYNVSAFVKVEKWQTDHMCLKPPRLIQFRSFVYCAALSQYLSPIEELAWTTECNGVRVFAKGLNSYEVAETLWSGWTTFSNPIAVLLDHSRFDSSVMKEHIKIEETCYLSRYADDDLRQLISHQYANNCYTKGGIAYTCVARKMSGEYNTSLGDSVINYGVLRQVFGSNVCYTINGDDSVIIMEESDLDEKVALDPATWAKFGFKSTVSVARSFAEIDFCQSKPVLVDGVWRMVRSPWRAIARGTISVKRFQGEGWRRLLASMAESELACSDRVPMLQAWGQYLLRCSAGASALPGEITYKAKLERRPSVGLIANSTRHSFAEVFGIDIDQQLAFEEWCERAPAVCLQLV